MNIYLSCRYEIFRSPSHTTGNVWLLWLKHLKQMRFLFLIASHISHPLWWLGTQLDWSVAKSFSCLMVLEECSAYSEISPRNACVGRNILTGKQTQYIWIFERQSWYLHHNIVLYHHLDIRWTWYLRERKHVRELPFFNLSTNSVSG